MATNNNDQTDGEMPTTSTILWSLFGAKALDGKFIGNTEEKTKIQEIQNLRVPSSIAKTHDWVTVLGVCM